MNTSSITKADNGKRYYVIAQQYPSGLKVAEYFTDISKGYMLYEAQYARRHEIFAFEFGEAVCSVTRMNRVSWGLFEPMVVRYRNFEIVPKLDFGTHGYIDGKGRVIKAGFVVCQGDCNIMPGATWFETIKEAKNGIDVYIKVEGNADKFWEVMQPFEYKRVGQKSDIENGEVRQGRFYAKIENHRVVKLRKDLPANGL